MPESSESLHAEKWANAARWLFSYRGHLLNGVGTLTIAFGVGWLSSNWGQAAGSANQAAWGVAVIGLTLYVWGMAITSQHGSELSKLQTRVEELEGKLGEGIRLCQMLWNGQLALFFNSAGLGSTERVSIYRHSASNDEGGGEFHLLARYSVNPELAKKGRGRYPDDEGCIATTWREQECHIEGLPDPRVDKETYYEQQNAEFGLSEETLDAMRMLSRAYLGYRVDGAEPGQWLAVLMIESENPAGLSEKTAKKLRRTFDDSLLAQIVDFTSAFEPDPDIPNQRGY